jgi:hypothetical protein
MKSRLVLIAILTFGTILGLIGWTGYGQKQQPSKNTWEYKTAFVGCSPPNPPENWLTEAGSQGWELVSVTTEIQSGNTTGRTFYFKRAK